MENKEKEMVKKSHEEQIPHLKGKITGKENTRPENEEENHPKQSRSIRGKEIEQDATEQEKADPKHFTQKQDATEPRHRNLALRNRTSEEHEQNSNGATTDRTVTIQTAEGSYEARLVGDNANNFPVQKDETRKISDIQSA